MGQVNPNYLIPQLRLTIGDINPDTFRYTDEWCIVAVNASLSALQAWWTSKYIIDADGMVSRNPNSAFYENEPPVIQPIDERPIVLMAAIILLEGSLEANSYVLNSWKDNEISFTNLEMGRIKDNNLNRLWNELTSLLKPPLKKLARPTVFPLAGFKNNIYERTDEF